MNRVKVAVALGMVTAAVLFFPIVELLISDCISDATCSLSARIFGAVLASCSVGLSVAWAAERLIAAMANRRSQARRD
jgi:hypothetical protein